MTYKPGAGADARHPHPESLLELIRRHPTTLTYIVRTVEWLREEYPGSVDELVPRLREMYRQQKAQGVRA